jgi:Rrf2 family transcriptional regulator, iron-sulfur cluster assembly transcription factor
MLSITSEYAIRALSCLARAAEGQALLGREIAILAGVPANYLAKILLDLKRTGIVAATRGSGGGYRLARPATEIRLIEVVGTFEGSRESSACILGGGRVCSDLDPCPAHAKFHLVRRAYFDFLENTTLAEISAPPDETLVEVPAGGEVCAR